MYHKKLQASVELKKKGWKGTPHCSLCGAMETNDHILFTCPLSSFIWCCIRDALGWERFPTSTLDFMENWIPNKFKTNKSLRLTIFSGFMWAVWKTRNKMAIEKKIPQEAN